MEPITAQESGFVFERQDFSALDSQWPGWRGPATNGLVPSQPLLTTWSETENVIWSSEVPGRGHSSPVVVNGMVVLTTADEAAQEQSVVAYHAEDGTPAWQTILHTGGFPGSGQMHQKSTHANGTVATDGTSVFAAFLNAGKIFVSAVDLQSGEQVWQTELGAFASQFGYAPSPILYHNLVIVAADNSGGGYIAAVDAADGQIAWRIKRHGNTFSTPTVVTFDGIDQLLISGNQKIFSYDPVTGQENWKVTGTAKSTCGTIVANQDLLFASGGYPERELICLNAAGQNVWKNKTRLYEPSLLLVGDYLYAITDDSIAHCFAAADGTEQWKQRLSGGFSASPIHCDGKIYVSSLDGRTFVFAAAGDSYQEIAVNQLGTDCYASPAVHDSRLFLRVGFGNGAERLEKLYCLGETP